MRVYVCARKHTRVSICPLMAQGIYWAPAPCQAPLMSSVGVSRYHSCFSGGLSVLHCPQIATSLSVWVSQVLCVLVFLSSFLCRAVLPSPFLGVCASALLTPLVSLGFCKAPGQPRGPSAALTSPACPFTPSLTLPCPAVPTKPFLAPSNMGMCSASKGLCLSAPAPGPSLSARC